MQETTINGVVIETDMPIRVCDGVVEVGSDPEAFDYMYNRQSKNSALGSQTSNMQSGGLNAAFPGIFVDPWKR
jgi:hypothetical protein